MIKNNNFIEPLLKNIFIKDHWDEFDLHMSESGFNQLEEMLKEKHNDCGTKTQSRCQVYVHVCIEDGPLNNKIIRLGKSEAKGYSVYERWINANDSHKVAFFWPMGLPVKSSNSYKSFTGKFFLFFAGLANLKTKLFILNCEDKTTAQVCESILLWHFDPLWEKYVKIVNGGNKYEKIPKDSPLDLKLKEKGEAYRLLDEQRNSLSSNSSLLIADSRLLAEEYGSIWNPLV